MFVESVVIALFGGLLGLPIAFLLNPFIAAFLPPANLPVAIDMRIDVSVFVFCLAASVFAGLVLGSAPVLTSIRGDLSQAMRDGGRGVSVGSPGAALRRYLTVAQVGASVALLIVGGILVQGLRAGRNLDPGFATSGLLLASIDVSPRGFTVDERLTFYDMLGERIAALPGVESSVLASRAPLSIVAAHAEFVRIDDDTEARQYRVLYSEVGAAYFETLSIPLVQGRTFRQDPVAGSLPEAVVSQAMADRFWGGSPLGRTFVYGGRRMRVVGVAEDVMNMALGPGRVPYFYAPRTVRSRIAMTIIMRTSAEPASLAPAVRGAVSELDPTLAVFDVVTMPEHMQAHLFIPNATATLASACGLIALLLSAIGIYGVIADSVSRRTHEIGVRLALGARQGDIVAMVVRQGLGLGLAAGMVAAGALEALVFGVATADPLVLGFVVLTLGAVSIVASLPPAVRAASVDPLDSLRCD